MRMRLLIGVAATVLLGISGASAQQSEATLRLLERNKMFEPGHHRGCRECLYGDRLPGIGQLHDCR